MQYYRYLFLETKDAFSNFLACMERLRNNHLFFFFLIVIFGIVSLSVILLFRTAEDRCLQFRIGTVAFWTTASVATFGLAGIIYLIACHFSRHYLVYRYRVRAWPYVVGPSLCVLGAYFITDRYYSRIEMTPYKAIYAGFVCFFAQIVWALIKPSNRPFFIQIIQGFSDKGSLIKLDQGVREARKTLLDRQDKSDPFKTEAKKTSNGIRYRVFSESDLESCLLLKEDRNATLERSYQKTDGAILKVVEIESLTGDKIWNSLAGLILFVMINTPYVSYMFDFAVSNINKLMH